MLNDEFEIYKDKLKCGPLKVSSVFNDTTAFYFLYKGIEFLIYMPYPNDMIVLKCGDDVLDVVDDSINALEIAIVQEALRHHNKRAHECERELRELRATGDD